MGELERIDDLARRAGSTRCCGSPPTPATPSGARCCSGAARRARRWRRRCCSSSSSGTGRRRARRGAARRRAARLVRHYLRMRRYRPHQLSEPEERILTETDGHRPSAFRRLFTEQISAIPSSSTATTSRCRSRRRSAACRRRTAPAAQRRRPGVTRRSSPGSARARSSSTPCCRTSRPRTGCAYPHWLAARNLANEASDESVAALVEAVVAPLRAAAALVPAEGRLLGLDTARLLRPDGAGRRDRARDRVGRRARAGARLLPRVLPRARRRRAGSSRAAASTRRRSRASAAAPSAPTPALAPPVRAAQLHLARRRRADDGARARATACTRRWRGPQGCSTSRRR